MRRRDLLLLVTLGACAPADRGASGGDAGPIDAAGDARVDDKRVPFTTTGTTPAGSLDDIRYLGVEYLSGFCLPTIGAYLFRTNLASDLYVVRILVPLTDDGVMYYPTEPQSVLAAKADLREPGYPDTEEVSFEVVHVDMLPTDPLRLAGRLTANTGGWSIDVSFDVQTSPDVCI